ncbi:MAG: sodium-dependent bicarbonate transport family permease, partial [Flavicella sp.]|nr:sodium-dependent bicarbonate transport family permease [Flavicella sp.]
LEIPPTSSKFISLYLLFAIGFKGGQELSHEAFSSEIIYSMLFGVFIAVAIPLYTFFILKKKFNVQNAGAIAAAYGSVSAVTFVTAISYLEAQNMHMSGHMVAIMAIMESPAIIAGLILISFYNKNSSDQINKKDAIKHSLTNGSVLLILGSLIIGFLASAEQANDIKPFTDDLFKGFLAIFLLDMGIVSGKKINSLVSKGIYPILFAILIPIINGIIFGILSGYITDDTANRFIFSILAASASYIAVPAAMKMAVPKANPGLYLPMALAVTFPVNITIGMPIYLAIVQNIHP